MKNEALNCPLCSAPPELIQNNKGTWDLMCDSCGFAIENYLEPDIAIIDWNRLLRKADLEAAKEAGIAEGSGILQAELMRVREAAEIRGAEKMKAKYLRLEEVRGMLLDIVGRAEDNASFFNAKHSLEILNTVLYPNEPDPSSIVRSK